MTRGCLDEQAALEYLGGGGDRDDVIAHLDGCDGCRAFLLSLARLQRAEVSSGAATMPASDGQPAERKRIGRFTIGELLGAGAMGAVYRAEDADLRRPVAIKVMREAYGGEAARTRMLREAQAMAALDHPNVIRVYEVGRDDAGDLFIAMEYVAGTTLGRWLREPHGWRAKVDAFMMAGRGLAAAHAVGVIHRDFKPDNAMVDHTGRVKVGDFGLARAASSDDANDAHEGSPLAVSMTQTGAVIGTPIYMSPEQLSGQPADARGDQFALCVAIYEALYGERPFAGADLAELRAATQRGPRRPRTRGGPAALWPVLRRGLAPDPADRFATVDELLAAIERALRVRRRMAAGIAVAGVVLAGAATAAVLVLRGAPAPDPTAKTWSPERESALRAALQRSHRPAAFVADQANRVVAGVEHWVADWRRAAATVATDADAGPAITRHRRACLDLRLRELDKVIELVVAAKDDELDGVVPSLGAVRSPLGCQRALPSPTAPPPPQGATARIADLAISVDLAELLDLAGHSRDAIAAIDKLEPELRQLAYAPLLARALYVRGAALGDQRDPARSRRDLTEANQLVASAGDVMLELKVLAALIFDAARSQETLDRARAWLGAAEQALARARSDRTLQPDELALIEMVVADAAAQVPATTGDAKAVLEYRTRELDAARRARGEHSRQYGMALASHGRALWRAGRGDEGGKELQQAVAVLRDALGSQHPLIAGVLVSYADLELTLTKFDEARRDFDAALAIETAAYGPDHVARLPGLLGLANLDNIAGDSAKVLERTHEIIRLTKAAYGDDAAELATPLQLQANAQLGMGDTGAARESAAKAAAIDERVLGKQHPSYGSDLMVLGIIELTAGNYAQARKAFDELHALRGADDADTGVMLGELDLAEGKPADALARFHEATVQNAAKYGEDYPVLSITRGGEGRALVALGKLREAEPLLVNAEKTIRALGMTGAASGQIRLALSRVAFGLHRDRTRAIELAKGAREELSLSIREPGARAGLAEATAWLDKLGAR